MEQAEKTLASLVINNYKTAGILEKYNLDYCCKGKRTLSESCKEKGIDTTVVINDLMSIEETYTRPQLPFEDMTAEQLISYILIHHHFYVKQTIPQIIQHVQKVAMKHGDKFEYIKKVYENFKAVAEELLLHMEKEELMFFPRIKEIEKLVQNQNSMKQYPAGYITAPIHIMEQEHEHAGELMAEIRQLTGNFTAPLGACTTFRITLQELKEFEEDLHKHVHLENYILFPKAVELIKSVVHE
ncbi:iron-sulfur cluster repair di-iron protein [soil metagenome]